MCGIVGGLNLSAEALRAMTEAVSHRGPDDGGLFWDESVGLGARRLAILDLPGGRQPMISPDGRLTLVFNGEIYNFQELRGELEARGRRFRTRSDTEVVLCAYEEWGNRAPERLRGMFAFSLFDRDAGTLFLARDRLGIKPLYYYDGPQGFLFASEVRALFKTGRIPLRLCLEALYSYLLFGSVQEPLTLAEGVYSLPPAHALEVNLRTGNRRTWRYWNFPEGTRDGNPRTVGMALAEAIRSHLVADVPLGVFLSGGLDSATLVALASRTGGGLRTFTLAFGEEGFSEAEVARRTAEHFGTDHTEVLVTPEEILRHLPQALSAMDQPTMDGINTSLVSWAAREAGLKVALSGIGGDELFAGYSTFTTVPRMARLRALLGPMGLPLSRLTNFFPAAGPETRRKARALLRGDIPFGHAYFLARSLFLPRAALSLLSPEAQAALPDDSPWRARVRETLDLARRLDPVNAVSFLECNHYLVSTLLRDTDQMSMAHSVEVRVPFLDHPMVEHILGLPGHQKAGRPWDLKKPLLVTALNGLLPSELARLLKRTFTLPWEIWLRGPLKKEVEEVLNDPPAALRDLVSPEAIRAIWQAFLHGRTTWSRPWTLYVLFRWTRQLAMPARSSL